MDVRQSIAELLAENSISFDGTTAKTGAVTCPFCNGGEHYDKSFQIWYTPQMTYYKCYRGKCGVSGRIPNVGDVEIETGPALKPKNIYHGDFTRLNKRERDWVQGKYLSTELFGNLHKNSKCGRLVVTLRDEWMVPWGVELKNWNNISHFPKSSRKYLRYDHTGNNLGWAYDVDQSCMNWKLEGLFITEDVISAYRIQRLGYHACALLGTKLRQEDALKILRQGYSRLILCLDPDEAGVKATSRLYRDHSFMFDISSRSLTADPKYLSNTQLLEQLDPKFKII